MFYIILLESGDIIKKEKPLFTCESDIEANDYKKLTKYFPNKFYWPFVKHFSFINFIFCLLFSLIEMRFESWFIPFIFLQVLIMILCRVNLSGLAAKAFKNSVNKKALDTHFDTEFFEDYFVRKGETVSYTIKYSKINKCIETDNCFYLEWTNRNTVIILKKSECSLEVINFIRDIFKIDNRLVNKK